MDSQQLLVILAFLVLVYMVMTGALFSQPAPGSSSGSAPAASASK